MRNKKYQVTFYFTSRDGNIKGGINTISMESSAVEFMLRTLSPLSSNTWVDQFQALRFRGSSMIIQTREMCEFNVELLKVIKIVRA